MSDPLLAATPLPPHRGTNRIVVFVLNGCCQLPGGAGGAALPSAAQVGEEIAQQLNGYYGPVSQGQLRFIVAAFGGFQVSVSGSCNPNSWTAQTIAQARARHLALGGYQQLMLAFPAAPGCRYGGLADEPGRWSWINGDLLQATLVHEVAHNLGLGHADAFNQQCVASGQLFRAPNGCTLLDYGDPWDAMAAGSGYAFSTWHQAQLGWLDGSEQLRVSASGTYTLAAAEGPRDSGVKLLTIERGDGYAYVLEKRAAEGLDQSLPGNVTNAVIIRLVADNPARMDQALIDTNPSTDTFDDAPLQLGQSFTDSLHGITIRLDALTADEGAIVTITLG